MASFKGVLINSLLIVAVCCCIEAVSAELPHELPHEWPFEWPQEWSRQSPNRKFFAKGIDYMDQFKAISEFLEKKVPNEEIDANFKAIDLAIKNPWRISGGWWDLFHQILDRSKTMKEALNLFSSLRQINEKNQCNLSAYNILKVNYNAANGLTQWGYERLFKNRRINKIVRGFVERHAETCRPLYFDLYKEQIKMVDPIQKEFAEQLVKNMIYKRHGKENGDAILGDAQKLLEFAQEYAMTFKVMDDPAYCLQEMRRLTKNDPNSNYTEPQAIVWLGKHILEVNREEMLKLFRKYMLKPCKEYVMKIETIFEPANYDTEFLVTPAKPDELDYYLNWAAFELCDAVVVNDSAVVYSIKEYADRMAAAGLPF